MSNQSIKKEPVIKAHYVDNVVVGFYDTGVHSEIPEPNIEVSACERLELLANPDAWEVQEGKLSRRPRNDLDVQRARQNAIDNLIVIAEQRRSQLTGQATGLIAAYQIKYLEAVAYLAEPAGLINYPILNAESTAAQTEPKVLARQIIEKHQEWVAGLGEIEAWRQEIKIKLTKATTEAQIAQIQAEFMPVSG